MCALIATRYLMRASSVWKLADINMLDVGARDGKRDFIFGLARGRARVTAYATCMVDYFSPLNRLGFKRIDGEFSH